jgi:hypothetical protein
VFIRKHACAVSVVTRKGGTRNTGQCGIGIAHARVLNEEMRWPREVYDRLLG